MRAPHACGAAGKTKHEKSAKWAGRLGQNVQKINSLKHFFI
jgi:hypothetical protein